MTYPIFYSMGALAAQTTADKTGFRQRELRFYAELFSNWVTLGGIGVTHAMHNTQIARFLTYLVTDGQAKQLGRSRPPTYRLTRAGIFAVTATLTSRSYIEERAHGLLVWYFLKSYTKQIKTNMMAAGSDFSRAHQMEMDQLLNTERFAARQIQFADQEIQRLKARIDASEAIEKAVTKLKENGATLTQCIDFVADKFPYELNPQRSFKETLEQLPASVSEWEIGAGSQLRATCIFRPMLRELEEYAAKMRELQKSELSEKP